MDCGDLEEKNRHAYLMLLRSVRELIFLLWPLIRSADTPAQTPEQGGLG